MDKQKKTSMTFSLEELEVILEALFIESESYDNNDDGYKEEHIESYTLVKNMEVRIKKRLDKFI
jgi:hypothetical protein